VCPLSHRMMLLSLNPYPARYRSTFAFSTIPCPHPYRLPLQVALPFGRDMDLIAVGHLFPAPPRPDPYAKNYFIRLLPWVSDAIPLNLASRTLSSPFNTSPVSEYRSQTTCQNFPWSLVFPPEPPQCHGITSFCSALS
jgi:hypothetical protein